MKNILVTGGAGYIGSHTLRALRENGYTAICFDNLSTGYRELADDFPLIEGDLTRAADVERVFAENRDRCGHSFCVSCPGGGVLSQSLQVLPSKYPGLSEPPGIDATP